MTNAEIKDGLHWSWFLPILSGVIVLSCLIYCRFWWTPMPMGLTDPDTSVVCWLFCKTQNTFWFYLGVLFAFFSISSGIMWRFGTKHTKWTLFITGLLIAPTGFINLVSFYFYRKYQVEG
jgi:hypothetical protein